MKEIAYVKATDYLIRRLGPKYKECLDKHPSHEHAAQTRLAGQKEALEYALNLGTDSAILDFIKTYSESKLIPEVLKRLAGYTYTKIEMRRLLPYSCLGPGFRDMRNLPGGIIENGVRMSFHFVHGPWPKGTKLHRANNRSGVSARRSNFYAALGGRIDFEQWGYLGGIICKGSVEFEDKGIALLPGTQVYLPEGRKRVRLLI
ncbi:hypothetical protein ACFL6U_22675 [Planctomycetota bacterium]